jgi:two-component system chemotaxis response regulator CheB
LTVKEAEGGEEVRPGTVWVAPGDHHLELRREGGGIRTHLSNAAPENYCRPAVDVLFRSAAQIYGGAVLACVLTGMGHDGGVGSKSIVAAGGTVIVQDEKTSVVWGMPGTVAMAGSAAAVLPLDRIADALNQAARSNALVGTP